MMLSVKPKLLRRPTSSLDDFRKSGNYPTEWKNYIASWRLSKDKSLDETVKMFNVSRNTIYKWCNVVKSGKEHLKTGRPCALDAESLAVFREAVVHEAQSNTAVKVTGPDAYGPKGARTIWDRERQRTAERRGKSAPLTPVTHTSIKTQLDHLNLKEMVADVQAALNLKVAEAKYSAFLGKFPEQVQGLCNKFVATEHVTDEELQKIELVSKLAPTVGVKDRNRDKNCINKQRCRILLGPELSKRQQQIKDTEERRIQRKQQEEQEKLDAQELVEREEEERRQLVIRGAVERNEETKRRLRDAASLQRELKSLQRELNKQKAINAKLMAANDNSTGKRSFPDEDEDFDPAADAPENQAISRMHQGRGPGKRNPKAPKRSKR